MKNYLVTGAAGFIGSAIAKRLIDDNNNVVTIDNLSTGFKESIPSKVKFYKGDCSDEKIIKKLEDYNFDCIIHVAGQSSGEISFDDPIYDLNTNTKSTLLLLKLALKIKCKKFIYASTMSVYGDQKDEPIKENVKLIPKSFYGIGKVASENYLRLYQQYGIECVSLRLFNVYGPGQNMKNLRQGMVSIFLAQAIKNKKVLIKGDLNRFRDFVYIDDVVDAFLKSIKYNFKEFKCFNVSYGKKTTIDELLNLMKSILPYNIKVKVSGSTMGDQFGIFGDISSAKKYLLWKPKYSLEKGLKKMIEWSIKYKNENN